MLYDHCGILKVLLLFHPIITLEGLWIELDIVMKI